ncbi:putative Initiator Rep protein domain protein [Candidatus Magnetomoraceae bacterium gMMP-15]
MDEVRKKRLVVKSNKILEARYELSVQEQRLISSMASMIKKDDEDFRIYRFEAKKLAALIGIKPDGYYQKLKKTTKQLLNKTFIIKESDGDLQIGWLSSAKYFKAKGYVELEFSPRLKPYLLYLKEAFTRYQLKNIIRLRSIYSIRLYELLKQYEFIGERTLELEELKYILNIINKYKAYRDFKKRVLLSAQKEINKKTDISFTFEEKKQARKVVAIVFKIKSKISVKPDPPDAKALPAPIKPVQNQNPKIQNQVIETTPVSTISENILILIPQEYVENQDVLKNIRKYLKTHNKKYVINQIQYTRQNSKKEGGFPGYFAQSLKNGWGNGLEAMRQQKKQLAEAKAEQEAKLKAKREAEEKLLKNLKKEFRIHSKNQLNEALAKLSEDDRTALKEEFKQDLFNKKSMAPALISWRNGEFDNRNIQLLYESFLDEKLLAEEDREFKIWVKNKGYKLVQQPDGTYKVAL